MQKYVKYEVNDVFENIGGKIKVVAKVECWLGIFSSISIGVNLISTEEEFLVFTGILVMIVGAITAWLGSFLIYGFGQLVENSDILTGRAVKKDETVRNV